MKCMLHATSPLCLGPHHQVHVPRKHNMLDYKGLTFYYDEIHPDGNTGHRSGFVQYQMLSCRTVCPPSLLPAESADLLNPYACAHGQLQVAKTAVHVPSQPQRCLCASCKTHYTLTSCNPFNLVLSHIVLLCCMQGNG